jgi:hypothetical protein
LGQQIEPRAPEHLALEHFQAVDLPFNRSLTPGQRDSCLHGGVRLTHSVGNAPQGGASGTGDRRGSVAGEAGSCSGVGRARS